MLDGAQSNKPVELFDCVTIFLRIFTGRRVPERVRPVWVFSTAFSTSQHVRSLKRMALGAHIGKQRRVIGEGIGRSGIWRPLPAALHSHSRALAELLGSRPEYEGGADRYHGPSPLDLDRPHRPSSQS